MWSLASLSNTQSSAEHMVATESTLVVCPYIASSKEIEAGGPEAQGQPRLHETLSLYQLTSQLTDQKCLLIWYFRN